MNTIILKSDKRYRLGNIKRKGNILRGHPETLDMKRLYVNTLSMQLNPPIVISCELVDELKKIGTI